VPPSATSGQPEVRRSWLVTGASRGIGQAVAARAVAAGDRVALLARGGEVEEVARRLGGGCVGHRVDVRNASEIERAVAEVAAAWGTLDVLVNNAGLHRGGVISRLTDEDWSDVLATNLTGPVAVIRETLPYMEAGASIVNVGAVVGLRGFPGDAAYGASKAGLSGLTQVLAAELARKQIRVNLVVPGMVPTEMTSGVPESARRRLVARVPLGREGTAAEIADVIWWVSGSSYMTGATVVTDGGLMCAL
jgi:3-oxoacyl-[acyl-carrier protein] reductase